MERLGVSGKMIAVDCSEYAPAFYRADVARKVPRCTDPDFVPVMLDLCREEKIRLIVPTIDTELPVYAEHRAVFESIGTRVAVSHPDTVEIAADKSRTNAWLVANGFPTVRQGFPEEVMEIEDGWSFPLVVKPRCGSASVGVQIVTAREFLPGVCCGKEGLVVEEQAPGIEHTINVYVSRSGKCMAAVPHKRLEVRAGEVSKGITVRNEQLMNAARNIAEALPGAHGPMNIQMFLTEDHRLNVIEINPRFGGGYPLSHAAGADFPGMLIREALGEVVDRPCTDWQDGLVMLRYDDAVFLHKDALGT